MSAFACNECSFDVPGDYDDKSVSILNFPYENEFNIVLSRDIDDDKNLIAYAKVQVNKLSASLPKFNIITHKEFRLNGRPAVLVEFHWASDKGLMFQRQVYFATRINVIIVTGTELHQFSAEQDQLWDKLFRTIRFNF